MCDDVRVIENDRAGGPLKNKRALQLRSLFSQSSYESLTQRRPQFQVAIDAMLAQRSFDIVTIESVQMGYYEFPANVATVVDEHNIEYDLARRAAALGTVTRRVYGTWDAHKLRREEERLWQTVDGCAVPSERDEIIVRRAAPHTPTVIVPNGVDTSFFAPFTTAADPSAILFFGSLNHQPNADALEFFARKVMPLLRRSGHRPVLRIVGHAPSAAVRALAADDIILVGGVDDVRLELARASVIVAPLRAGGGTRVKILEAMAMGRPVVSTTIGAEGIAAQNGRDIVIADDPALFADAIIELLRDPARARALGEAGRALVAAKYDWSSAVRMMELLYRRVRTARTRPATTLIRPSQGA